MKLLCLHGYSTNGSILSQQHSNLCTALGDHHEYIFLDGEDTAQDVIPAIKSVFSGPYLAYHESMSASSIQLGHDLITATIEAEDLPIDGILAFSQGGALALSYLIQHRIDHPNALPPFKFAVIMSPAMVGSPDPNYLSESGKGYSWFEKLSPSDQELIHDSAMNKQTIPRPEDLSCFDELSKEECEAMGKVSAMMQTVMLSTQFHSGHALSSCLPRYFNAVWTKERVLIPMIHTVGKEESRAMKRVAGWGRELCGGGNVWEVELGGEHDVPSREGDVRVVVGLIEKAYYIGSQMFCLL